MNGRKLIIPILILCLILILSASARHTAETGDVADSIFSASLIVDMMIALLAIIVIKVVTLTCLSYHYYRRSRREPEGPGDLFVSVIVPCYNE